MLSFDVAAAAMVSSIASAKIEAYKAGRIPVTSENIAPVRYKVAHKIAMPAMLSDDVKREVIAKLAHELAMTLIENHLGLVEDVYDNTTTVGFDIWVKDA